jgi:hypothetical protein
MAEQELPVYAEALMGVRRGRRQRHGAREDGRSRHLTFLS